MLSPQQIITAHQRIQPYIYATPLIQSPLLNQWLGHHIFFKVEGQQRSGSFKIRGALNALLTLREKQQLPSQVVTLSSGNHAQACALAGQLLGIKVTVFIPQGSSSVKIQATQSYGAQVEITATRAIAEQQVAHAVSQGAFFLPPYDHDDLILGQGTSCYEALQHDLNPNAIFATCGGGGWLSGSFLAKQLLSPASKLFAGEPANANDASQSYRAGKLISLPAPPQTLADGARVSCVAARTFEYLQHLDGFFEASEARIIYWTQWLNHLLKCSVEPTSAVAMEAAYQWLTTQSQPQKILVLLSGGNMDAETYRAVWENSYLQQVPAIEC
jgi:threonine dehydratase